MCLLRTTTKIRMRNKEKQKIMYAHSGDCSEVFKKAPSDFYDIKKT